MAWNRYGTRLAVMSLVCLPFAGVASVVAAEPKPSAAAVVNSPPVNLFPDDPHTWLRAAETRIVSDFSQAQPAEALTTGRREKQKWKLLPFATDDIEGTALSTFRDTDAPTVRLPLKAEGWHAVYVGVCTVSAGLDKADDNGVRVKLSGDRVFRRMSNGMPLLKPRRDIVQEIFLTAADLTGQSLDVAPMPFKPATVCYVKLVPLTEAEITARKYFTRDPATRPIIATFDGHSWIWPYRPRTIDHLQETFRGFERTDVTKWWFQVGGADLTCYASQVGNIMGDGTKDFCRWEYAEFTQSLEALFAAKINPFKVARDQAARQGAEFHVMIRPSAWGASLPFDEIFNSRFFAEHPQWRCVDRDGTPTLHMSYAFPEVRKQVLDVLRETLELRPDGVGYLFHRGMPMILWEEPFCRAFREKYGDDARQVPEDDPRILDLRAEMTTQLLRETRRMLDEVAESQGREKPFKISLAVFSKETDNRKFGLDVERWIQGGLVDDLAVAYFAHHTSFSPPDMDYYRRITSGTQVGLYPFVIAWHSGKPQELCTKVDDFYKAGATGIAVWDPAIESHYRDGSPGNVFDIAGRLGHRDWVSRWAKQGPPQPPSVPLKRLGDNYYSRWFPNTGY